MTPLLLSATYFGPVEWYAHLARAPHGEARIEACETFPKQTYRNRMVIAAESGPLALSIPVEGSSAKHQLMRDLRISEHGRWRHLHWQAIKSAYGESAFFEYYEDDLRPFYEDCGPSSPALMPWLLDYDLATAELMARLLDLDTRLTLTAEFTPPASDLRYTIAPKLPPTLPSKPYYQVYRARHGFLPNLSILDLLFNLGPEAPLVLLGR